MIFDLVRDFADTLAAMSAEHPRRRILSLLNEAVRRDVHFIDRHPTTLLQCLTAIRWAVLGREAEAITFSFYTRKGRRPEGNQSSVDANWPLAE